MTMPRLIKANVFSGRKRQTRAKRRLPRRAGAS